MGAGPEDEQPARTTLDHFPFRYVVLSPLPDRHQPLASLAATPEATRGVAVPGNATAAPVTDAGKPGPHQTYRIDVSVTVGIPAISVCPTCQAHTFRRGCSPQLAIHNG